MYGTILVRSHSYPFQLGMSYIIKHLNNPRSVNCLYSPTLTSLLSAIGAESAAPPSDSDTAGSLMDEIEQEFNYLRLTDEGSTRISDTSTVNPSTTLKAVSLK